MSTVERTGLLRPPVETDDGPTWTQHHRRRLLTLLLVDVAALASVLLLRDQFAGLVLADAARIATLVGVVALVSVAASHPRGYFSVSALYLATFLLFHLGLAVILAAGLAVPESYERFARIWLRRESTKDALVLVSAGILSFAASVVVSRVLHSRSRTGGSTGRQCAATDEGMARNLGVTGAALTIAAVLLWFYRVVGSSGLGVLLGSYGDFRAKSDALGLGYVYFAVGLGLALMTAAGPAPSGAAPAQARRAGYLVFAVFAIVALPLGARGEVLFPLLAAVAIAARRRRPVRVLPTVVLVVALLAGISALRDIREVGLAEISGTQVAASPLTGLAELGHSLRPVSEVVQWQRNGEPRLDGGSFIAPFDRPIGRALGQAPPLQDERLVNQTVQQRYSSGIGFSPVAEGFINFGLVGVLLFMAVIGLLLGSVDSWPATPYRLALVGALLVPLLIEIRNAFIFVPAQIGLGLLLVQAVRYWPRPSTRRGSAGIRPEAASLPDYSRPR